MNIIFIGYRCTGKTSAGRRLAQLLDLPFYDTDELVSLNAGKTVRQIVVGEGWKAFREAERAIVRDLSHRDGAIIALGGGAVLDPRNVEDLQGNGLFVWLFATAEEIMRRMGMDAASGPQRPPLTGEDGEGETARILVERDPVYGRVADYRLDTTGRDIEAVAEEIAARLRGRGRQQKGGIDHVG